MEFDVGGGAATGEPYEPPLVAEGHLVCIKPDVLNALHDANAVMLAMLEDVLAFAKSGWNNGTYVYCLVCDEQVNWGPVKGQRAPTFEQVAHDPECPIPDLVDVLSRVKRGDSSASPTSGDA